MIAQPVIHEFDALFNDSPSDEVLFDPDKNYYQKVSIMLFDGNACCVRYVKSYYPEHLDGADPDHSILAVYGDEWIVQGDYDTIKGVVHAACSRNPTLEQMGFTKRN